MEFAALLVVLVVVVVGIVVGRKLGRRHQAAQHRAQAEKLAQIADANHEGAKTRHEGGA